MKEQPVNESISLYKDTYSELYSALKWKVDKHSLMLIAAMYVTNVKEFHLKRFIEIADYIKDHVGMFSYLKSAQRFTIAATLDTTTEDPKESFHHFISIYDKLIENGFTRNAFSYIAAGTLLKVEPNRIDEIVQKTHEVYNGMRKNHFFLTNAGDYPLASILAQRELDSDIIVQNVEDYYQTLHKKGFYLGNDLQFLSHILALETNHQPEEKVEQCLMIRDMLKKANLKTKSAYYPYMGMLSFLENTVDEFESLVAINEDLNRDKLFKWNKDVNFMMSVLFLMNQFSAVGESARTGLNISIESLIQAQQAAMTASMTAAAVASSNSSSSS